MQATLAPPARRMKSDVAISLEIDEIATRQESLAMTLKITCIFLYDDEIKKAYRNLAKEHHPDLNPGDTESEHKFKEASNAYEVLKDPQKRAAYDRFGHEAFENGGRGHPGGGHRAGPQAGNFNDVFGDFFSDFMGGQRQQGHQSQKVRGSDLKYDVSITIKKSAFLRW